MGKSHSTLFAKETGLNSCPPCYYTHLQTPVLKGHERSVVQFGIWIWSESRSERRFIDWILFVCSVNTRVIYHEFFRPLVGVPMTIRSLPSVKLCCGILRYSLILNHGIFTSGITCLSISETHVHHAIANPTFTRIRVS
jgi:hypothetical protein